jgi:hypothetical protein
LFLNQNKEFLCVLNFNADSVRNVSAPIVPSVSYASAPALLPAVETANESAARILFIAVKWARAMPSFMRARRIVLIVKKNSKKIISNPLAAFAERPGAAAGIFVGATFCFHGSRMGIPHQ